MMFHCMLTWLPPQSKCCEQEMDDIEDWLKWEIKKIMRNSQQRLES
jgi:hypothetical protein